MDPVAEIGARAPAFELPDVQGRIHSLSGYSGRMVVLEFWSAKCPWSARVDQQMAAERKAWRDRLILLHIASNADEGEEEIREVAQQRGHKVVLIDTDQQVAEAYGAQTTPQFFLIDAGGVLRYQGALDDRDFRHPEPGEHYLRDAITAVERGLAPDPAETLAYGCALVRFEPKTPSDWSPK
jgi:peroxiredoxin